MSLILGLVLTGAAAIAGTVLCSPPAGSRSDRGRLLDLALATALAAGIVATGQPARAGERLQGRATVVDGSTLVVDGAPVVLSGIVTPDVGAVCWDAHAAEYACGRRIRAELAARIGGDALTCEARESRTERPAKAVCRIGDDDLGGWLVVHGYAMPDADAPASYRAASDRAWGRRAGLWSGAFADPAGWRTVAR